MGPYLTAAPESQVERIIGAILVVLRSDPALLAAGVRVIAREGDRKQLPPFVPEQHELPAVRVNEPQITGVWFEEGGHKCQLTLPVDLIYRGHHYVDQARMVEMWARAIFPADADRRDAVDRMLHQNESLGLLGLPSLATTADREDQVGDDQFAEITRCALVLSFEFTT